MLNQIKGLHHITSMASNAASNNHFFTEILGLRRVKKTVNFDQPDVYHLYYGNEAGSPGTVLTYFPFPDIGLGIPGTGEVGNTAFSVPANSLNFWQERLTAASATNMELLESFGEKRLVFDGPDGDGISLVEADNDERTPWTSEDISENFAIRGFHSASMRLKDDGSMRELLQFMNYEQIGTNGRTTRFIAKDGNGANIIDLETLPTIPFAAQGAGSVHHIAFAVENKEAQLEVRKALLDTGYAVTHVINRDYFHAIYFRTPEGVLFEIATNEPGFDRDEEITELGSALKLPNQHEHLREKLEQTLPSL